MGGCRLILVTLADRAAVAPRLKVPSSRASERGSDAQRHGGGHRGLNALSRTGYLGWRHPSRRPDYWSGRGDSPARRSTNVQS
jgi:hypothetical protein